MSFSQYYSKINVIPDENNKKDNYEKVFDSYEDYLDDKIKDKDLMYLEDEELARQVFEYKNLQTSEIQSRKEFEDKKRENEQLKSHSISNKTLSSKNKNFKGNAFLEALEEKEVNVLMGKLATIIFIRDFNEKGQEVSGYIDLGHRLKVEDCSVYFDRRKKMLPKPSDLSYFNWDTQIATSNPSSNFSVITDNENGLIFKNKRDRKLIMVDPDMVNSDNCVRTKIISDDYVQIVFYDHTTRRKS